MIVATFRLENVAAGVIERLEGARRSYAGRPGAFEALAQKATEEAVASVKSDYHELLGDDGHVERLAQELRETFLPRYLRVAQAHTEREAGASGLWAGGPLARAALFGASMLFAMLMSRLIRNPLVIAFYFGAFLAPFLPELRRWSLDRAYLKELQSLVDDLARVQEQLPSSPPPQLPPPSP